MRGVPSALLRRSLGNGRGLLNDAVRFKENICVKLFVII